VKYDRIAIDFLDWLRQLLWHREDVIKHRPYEVLKTMRGKYGLISKVDRRTPRAISTYTFSPFRYNQPEQDLRDIHLCCDHLGAIQGEKSIASRGGGNQLTHRISIYSASHFLDAHGSYDLKELFSGEYDLQGQDALPHRQASLVVDKVAYYFKERDPKAFNWGFEVPATVKEVMAGTWRSPSSDRQDFTIEGTLIDDGKPRKARITIKDDRDRSR